MTPPFSHDPPLRTNGVAFRVARSTTLGTPNGPNPPCGLVSSTRRTAPGECPVEGPDALPGLLTGSASSERSAFTGRR